MSKFIKYHTPEAFEAALIALEEKVETQQKTIDLQAEAIKKMFENASMSDVDKFYSGE